MSKRNSLIEFELKIRNWANFSSEGLSLIITGDPLKNKASITIRNLLNLFELRKKYAQEYLKLGAEQEKMLKEILELISYTNNQIKELLIL